MLDYLVRLEQVMNCDSDVCCSNGREINYRRRYCSAGGQAGTNHFYHASFRISITPLAIATHFGDVLILRESVSDDRVEKVCRYLSRISDGRVAVARCTTRGKDIFKEQSILYSISFGN